MVRTRTQKRKRESRGRRRTKTSEASANQKELKNIWISGIGGRKCWIKTQLRKNSRTRVGKARCSTIYPTQVDKNRNKLSVAKSHSPRKHKVEQMEIENLMAKQQAEQQLKERQYQLEKEREVMKLQLQQQGQEEELRLWRQK